VIVLLLIGISPIPPLAQFNPLNAELNPICHKLALLDAPYIYHISTLRVKEDTIFTALTLE
jgi:hypothetical protein